MSPDALRSRCLSLGTTPRLYAYSSPFPQSARDPRPGLCSPEFTSLLPGVHLAQGPPGAGGSRPPAHRPSNGVPGPRARPCRSSPRRSPGRTSVLQRSAHGGSAGLPRPGGQCVPRCRRQPLRRVRAARCGGPAPPPGPGLFTHSPSIPSLRHRQPGRLRAAATPPAPRPRPVPPRAPAH